MKKLLAFFLAFLFVGFLAFPSSAQARNIVGINIGNHFPEFDQAAAIVGSGGWIVVMACPGDGETLNQMFNQHPKVNIIIRGHYPTQDLVHKSNEWALSWVATLGRIQTNNKIYFIPWNEPNNGGVSGSTFTPDYYRDGATPEELINYINTFENYLTQAGLRSKVFLLSPAMNVSNPSFSWYVQAVGGGVFFNQFDGIALDMYDNEDCGSPFCYGSQYYNSHPNNVGAVLSEMGVAGKSVFFPETGVVIHSEPNPGPKYQDSLFYRYFSAGFPQWAGMGNFFIAAPFSYDPEGQEDWSIYGSQTANLFKNTAASFGSCCVEQSPQVNIDSFIANEKLYECEGAGSFAIGYDNSYCGQCGAAIGEPIIIGGSSNICADFVEVRESKSQNSTQYPAAAVPPPAPGGGSSSFLENINGTIALESVKFPNFLNFQESVVSAINKLLPFEFAQRLVLPGDTTLYFRQFAQGRTQAGADFDPGTTNQCTTCDQAPSAKNTLPANLWGRLAGAVRGLCSFLGINVCPPVANFQFSLLSEDYSCGIASCAPGVQVDPQNLPQPANEATNFCLANVIVDKQTSTSDSVNNNILTSTTTTTTRKEVKFLSRARLPGGLETVNNSEFFYSFLTDDVIEAIEPKDEAKALEEGFRYSVAFSPVDAGEHTGEYYELRKMRNAYCLYMCSIHPVGWSDPICPSCDPDYYKQENKRFSAVKRTPCKNPDGTPDWSRNPQDCVPPGCTWNPDYYACDYGYFCIDDQYLQCEAYKDKATLEHGCQEGSQGPLCENCNDSPFSLYIKTDQDWCGGGRNCQEGGVRCKWINRIDVQNDLYDDPKYNGCYYANSAIKVRKDGVGGCLGFCGGACPAD